MTNLEQAFYKGFLKAAGLGNIGRTTSINAIKTTPELPQALTNSSNTGTPINTLNNTGGAATTFKAPEFSWARTANPTSPKV